MTKLAAPGDDAAGAGVTAEALGGWGKTARLVVIRLSESAVPVLLLAWVTRR